MTERPTDASREVRNPLSGDFVKIDCHKYPHLRFEWHPKYRPNSDTQPGTVYVIRLEPKPGEPEHAEPIAWGIPDLGAAHNAVLCFLRGYGYHLAESTLVGAAHREQSPYFKLG